MRVIFVGLGKMGSQLVSKFLAAQHLVTAIDPNPEAVTAMVNKGAVAANSKEQAIHQFEPGETPLVWLMIPPEYVQDEVQEWLNVLPANSIIVDGGNSNYHKTMERAQAATDRNLHFIDVGTSGGVMGLDHGFSMMVGGHDTAFQTIEPLLKVLAEPEGAYIHTGPSGSGHYVKMVHNGIEYAIMQSYAEGYHLLNDGKDFANLNLGEIAHVWQGGSIIGSKLNSLIETILTENAALNGIDGFVADTGEGRWTYETSEAQGVPMPALHSALDVRRASQNGQISFATKLLAAMRNAFGGHAINKSEK